MVEKPRRFDRKIGVIHIKFEDNRYAQFLVVAPMSSGKSTLINSILGKRILATSNFACTSKETKIVINNKLIKNKLHIETIDGKFNVISDLEDKEVCYFDYIKNNIKNIVIETSSRNQIHSSKAIMLIDTPGGNYSQNDLHDVEMRKSLTSFTRGTIFYILNVTQVGTEDDYKILSEVKKSIKGKNIKIAFILNKIDVLDGNRENLQEFIKNVIVKFIENVGIKNYILFPCSSEAALLFKCALGGEELSETECDKLYRYYKYYYRNFDCMKHGGVDSNASNEEETVVYDGECYEKKKIKIALDNTGINEIEDFISKLSTQYKKIRTIKHK